MCYLTFEFFDMLMCRLAARPVGMSQQAAWPTSMLPLSW